ncbi:hypothetical protein AWB79_07251 [Caballeronia hypogeia]|uniref:Uncharacterized protein n=1 Tax=Caballeronia hypogeia TaxID=1777140 RepID=A0A158DLV1_9BURK|nr:hypothetical protein AWB79_07251 [Caballeronia hypogeia]
MKPSSATKNGLSISEKTYGTAIKDDAWFCLAYSRRQNHADSSIHVA